jgi:hypothetical protein
MGAYVIIARLRFCLTLPSPKERVLKGDMFYKSEAKVLSVVKDE